MTRAIRSLLMLTVALLAEGVDRNNFWGIDRDVVARVALLAEGVDRNAIDAALHTLIDGVALLAEGVDRNDKGYKVAADADRRPPRGGRG